MRGRGVEVRVIALFYYIIICVIIIVNNIRKTVILSERLTVYAVLFYNNDLPELMENFYTLTGIQIVLFDSEFNEILSFPSNEVSFCSLLRTDKKFDALCKESDKFSFEKCRKTHSLCLYKCHAGLIEATAPIMQNNAIIGYIMFGQITDIKDKDSVYDFVNELCKKYHISALLPMKQEKLNTKIQNRYLLPQKYLMLVQAI